MYLRVGAVRVVLCVLFAAAVGGGDHGRSGSSFRRSSELSVLALSLASIRDVPAV